MKLDTCKLIEVCACALFSTFAYKAILVYLSPVDLQLALWIAWSMGWTAASAVFIEWK